MNSIGDFFAYIEEAKQRIFERQLNFSRIIVGYGTCGIAAGAEEVYLAIQHILEEYNKDDILLEKSGCYGACSHEVMVDIELIGQPRVSYERVTPENIRNIMKNHFEGKFLTEFLMGIYREEKSIVFPIKEKKSIDYSLFESFPSFHQLPQFKKQQRVVLRNIGLINPEIIDEFIFRGGYQSFLKCLHMSQIEVIKTIKASKLRGRGGAGFPTGLKWEFAYKSQSKQKYVVVNADEGDPGAFMDRALIEGDPHSVLEGLMISAYATGANHGFVYIRAEYPLAIHRLEIALEQLKGLGLLGKKILGTDFDFMIEIRKGAGAFVCGEETGLMSSIMGQRGVPSPRPPYPTTSGLWGCPTTINNVKTLVTIPAIIYKGPEWFRNIGTEDTSGTAVFALAGDVINTGLVEVPMGTTLREIIFNIGGGIIDGRKFKAVQTGGPSGGCLPSSYLDSPVDFGTLKAAGSIMGSGGMIICSDTTCIVDLARYFLTFTQHESCGKCVPCREGTLRMLEILERITKGKAELSDLNELQELAEIIKDTSLCGLGQTAPNPVLSTLKYFREEYMRHIMDKRCCAYVCVGLFYYEINAEECIRCELCKRNCPVRAIDGSKEIGFSIDSRHCIRCGLCHDKCPADAIKTVGCE